MKKRKNYILKFLLLIFAIFSFEANCHVIFCDMGGVLLKNSKFRSFLMLGRKVIFHTDLKERFFEFVNLIDKEKSDEHKATFKGLRLPSFMCKWQAGELTSKQICDLIIEETEHHPNFFKNRTEKELIIETAKFLLPENSIKVTKPIKSMIKTIKELKEKKDKTGKPAHKLFMTTNCDEDTFLKWKKTFPEIFELFDADKIIVSGKIKKIKPNADFFDYIINKFKLKREDCILIDDQEENIKGAHDRLIKGIHHKSTTKTRSYLRSMGAL